MGADPTIVMVDQLLRIGTLTAVQTAVQWAVWMGLTAVIVLPWFLVLRRKR